MKKRLALVAAGAVVLLLAAPLRRWQRARPTRCVPYGWLLQLRGAKCMSLTNTAFHAWQAKPGVMATVVDDNKTPDDASDDLTYTGIALWRLVGRIDDSRPGSFNETLATEGTGYNVVVRRYGRLHRRRTRAPRSRRSRTPWSSRDRMNASPLTLGTASIKNDAASWKPNWPAKLVSSDTGIFGSRKPAGVVRISIVPATTTLGVDAGVPYGWLLQLRGAQAHAGPSYAFRAWARQARRAGRPSSTTTRRPTTPPTTSPTRHLRSGGSWAASTTSTRDASTRSSPPRRPATTWRSPASTASPPRYTSAEIATLKDALVVADRVNGKPLTLGTASIKNDAAQLEAQLAAQAGLERRQHLRQPQARRRRADQHRPGHARSAPF